MIAATERRFSTVDPATEQPIESYSYDDAATVDRALDGAAACYRAWSRRRIDERARLVRAVGVELRAKRAKLARLATREMGKPLAEAEAEVEKCALGCEFYADRGADLLANLNVATNARESFVAYRPLGVVLAIMPWNFPYWQVFRAAAPALVAGNTVVLKHAANVTGCAYAIATLFERAGFPAGAFNAIVVENDDMAAVVADPRIAAVTLTGSERAGASVAATAGGALKKTVLELGGSDAFIVLADADVARAAEIAVKARFQNAGQSCIAAKRFIVEEPVYDAFLEAFVARTSELVVGDPHDAKTTLGPLARADLRDHLEDQVARTLAAGAHLALGGARVDRPGYFYQPTIVTDVVLGMPLFEEETFGPAAAVVRARDVEHCIALANASPYGLGGNLWTCDLERARRLAERLESGGVFINGMTVSDPRLPFGGVKRSGYGRELSSFGIHEFVNVQTVWIGGDPR